MTIYDNYAETLLNMHQYYHELVLVNFDKQIPFNKYDYEKKMRFNWNEVLFKNKTDGKVSNIFPCCPLYNSPSYGLFSLEYRSYSGKIGNEIKPKVKKQIYNNQPTEWIRHSNGELKAAKYGLFDFFINSGKRYEMLYADDSTHYNLFLDLYNYSSYHSCERVWIGNEPIDLIAKNQDEYEALLVLSLMMFEQEVNYGTEIFQQYTNFTIDEGFRSRDMIMGFLRMMFTDVNTFNNYPYWSYSKDKKKKGFKLSPNFNGKYKNLDKLYKVYFEHFRNNSSYRNVQSLLSNANIRARFLHYAEKADNNPSLLSLE